MGGASVSQGIGQALSAALAVPTMGLSEVMGNRAGGLFASLGKNSPFTDIGGAHYAAGQQSAAMAAQQAQAAQLNQTLLTQPKTISPDNFLAQKSAQLANLRLGLASTIKGAGGAPPPVLGSNSLMGSYPGKSKLGT